MPIVEIACAAVAVREGRSRRMRFSGDIVDVNEAEAERLLSIGAIDSINLGAGVDLPAAASEPEAPIDRNDLGVPATLPPERPRSAAAKSIWEAYAAARGIDVTGLGKDEIIAAVDALGQQ